ncbi:FKBP-type peptidyl-prolyl cis-trans isomerase [Oceanospirillum linum]|uniref:Peptidyl-prolyl cis-trans isomerase n=1 Tax=Oceanospirillum linum TaxID=966 RepID=A0A1T1HA22_OCELI|nr:peptidylprolyl isomerase [Oceanospirillum linum]OOV86616.1 peptidylprolyl isomerase [Oceanospirillum linum]SEG28218.1 FKBP-type peptidyl prolyl cis-trans isomerase /Apo-metallochaperone SlyD [Oleiphilus messinensis]SMP27163.1 FKBP-type peptidyl prolyl cis-trans isomerase /Apo-metallochaperone SlyD [Oceanospirillum linum]
MQIQDNAVVSIHYTLTNEAGDTIDSSAGAEPLAYLHGAANIIPGLEDALVGKAAGDKLNVTVAPADGYGEHIAELVQEVPAEMFQGVDEVQIGMEFHAESNTGQPIAVTVTKVEDGKVTIDANHPLAGVTLAFDVEVVEVREATAEELEHGHVHGADAQEH